MSTPRDSDKLAARLPVRQVHDLPDAIHALVRTDADYFDCFSLTTPNARAVTPHRWARTTFEDAAGLKGQFIWRGLLGLRLKRRDPERIAGWQITASDVDWIRVEAHSWMMSGELIVHLTDDEVSLATAISYKRNLGCRVWTPLSAKHRALAPDLLRESHDLLFPDRS